MEPKMLDGAETKLRVLQMLEKELFVSLATFGTDGYPDVRVLLVTAKDGVDSIWFATETTSGKIAQLQKNPKAAIYGYSRETMTEFRLFGKVELLTDMASRQKIWKEEYIQHFPEGINSPTMVILRFNTERGMYDSYGREMGKF
jgi:general stress protein 26